MKKFKIGDRVRLTGEFVRTLANLDDCGKARGTVTETKVYGDVMQVCVVEWDAPHNENQSPKIVSTHLERSSR